MITNVKLGENVKIWHLELVNLYNCEIGDNTQIASFVEIGANVKIGKNCKIEAFAYIPEGVIIEDSVFIGPHVCFTNDKYPPSAKKWKTLVREGASIGANSTVLCGITIGRNAKIGAGSVVLRDVKEDEVVIGNPAGRLVNSSWGRK